MSETITSSGSAARKTRQRSIARSVDPNPGEATALGSGSAVTPERRQQLISETAYLKAERRGFTGGSPERDWLEAEQEVDSLLAQGATLR